MNLRVTVIVVSVQVLLFDFGLCRSVEEDVENYESDFPTKEPLSPIILIPGLGGNRMEAHLNKPNRPHFWCWKNDDWYTIWLNLYQLAPMIRDCWVDNMKLKFNRDTNETENTPGVQFRLIDWGQTSSMETITTSDPLGIPFGAYYKFLVRALTIIPYDHLRFERNKTLFGAPYDFRKGPNENTEWFEKMVNLTEHAYTINQNTKVTFIAHSMGGRMLLHFLQQRPQAWKDKYVKRIITLGVPWGGTIHSIETLAIGYDLGYRMISREKMHLVQKTLPSVVWLLPSPNFWEPYEVMAMIGNKTYTIENINDLFKDLGIPNIDRMRDQLLDYDNMTAPGVEVHCMWSHADEGTTSLLEFGRVGAEPWKWKGHGDGTVNRRSLEGCTRWINAEAQMGHEVHIKELDKVNHYDALSSAKVVSHILKIITMDPRIYARISEELEEINDMMAIRLF